MLRLGLFAALRLDGGGRLFVRSAQVLQFGRQLANLAFVGEGPPYRFCAACCHRADGTQQRAIERDDAAKATA